MRSHLHDAVSHRHDNRYGRQLCSIPIFKRCTVSNKIAGDFIDIYLKVDLGGICLCENDNKNWKGCVIHILHHVAVFTTENNYRKCWYKSLGMIAMKNHFKEHGRDNGRKLVRFWSWWNPNCREIPILKWRHNGHDDVSYHQPHHCLLNYYFSADQRKHQSSTSLAFVWGIQRGWRHHEEYSIPGLGITKLTKLYRIIKIAVTCA